MKKFLLLLIVLLSCPITGQAGQLLMPPQSNGLYDYRTGIELQEEFLSGSTSAGQIGSLGLGALNGSTTSIVSETMRYGLLRRDTSATINTIATLVLYPGSSNAIDPSLVHTIRWIVRLNTIDGNTTQRIGALNSTIGNPPSDGIYFEKLDADTNWFCVTRSSGTQTRTDSGIAVTSTFKNFLYQRTASGVNFLIDNVLACTHTTNITSNYVNPATQIINSVAAAKTHDHDYFELKIYNLSR